jgi:fatty-acyl-CoA synthase
MATEVQMQSGLAEAQRWNALTLPHLIERAGLDLGKPAVVFEGAQRTYGELREASRKVANALIGLGIEPLERVALLSANRLEFIEIEFGISAARGVMVALNWRLRAREVADLLNRSAARAIFVEDRFLGTILELRRAGAVPALRTIIGLERDSCDLTYEEILASSSPERPARAGRMDEPHEIMFTSGTTGEPKGVIWTDGAVLWNSLQQLSDFQLGPQHSSYTTVDQYDLGGRYDFTRSMLHQGATVHVKPSGGFDARQVVSYVAEHRTTHLLWGPTMLYEILRLPDLASYDLRALKMILCGGQTVSRETVLRVQESFPGADFVQAYGLTEGGGTLSFMRASDARARPGSVGKPALHVEMRLLDGHGQEVAEGRAGEIVIRAPSVTAGYWMDPDLTAQRVIDGWLHTGDMGYLDRDGFLYIAGRKSDVIVSGGMKIFPAEIEAVLMEHPSVGEVAVIGLLEEKWGETVCAVVEPALGATVDERELIAHCTERLASYKKPTSVRVVEEMPRTPDGTPHKALLRGQLSGTSGSDSWTGLLR